MKLNQVINLFLVALFLQSCGSAYYSVSDFESVKKIDAHIHYQSFNNAFSDIAIADNFKLIDINYDSNGSDSSLLKMECWSLKQKKQFPTSFEFITSFTLNGWDSANWSKNTIDKLQSSFVKGAIGVKIWKNVGMNFKDSAANFVMIDNPKFDKVVNYIVSQHKMIMGHLGEPKNCWLPVSEMTTRGDKEYFGGNPKYHMFLHPQYPSYEAQMNARDQFVRKHPEVSFVGAHFGSMEWSVDELAKRFDQYPNFSVDVSSRLAHIQLQSIKDYDKVRNFFLKYQDRLIYGSDEWLDEKKNPDVFKKQMHEIWLEQWRYLVTDETFTNSQINGTYKGLKLPKKVVDKLYRTNAMRWYLIK